MRFFQHLFIASFVVRFSDGAFYGNTTSNSTGISLPSSSLSSSSQYLSSIAPSSTGSAQQDSASVQDYNSQAINISSKASVSHGSSSTLWTNSHPVNGSTLRSSAYAASYPVLPSNSSALSFGPYKGSAHSTGFRYSRSLDPSRSHYARLNSSSARVTGTGSLQPLGTGNFYRGTGHGTGIGISNATASHKWSNATMTAAPPGFAVYGNSTFRTNCPHQTQYNSTDCYATCTKLADRCWSKWYTWSQGNNDYQASMQDEHGTVEVPEKTLIYTFPVSTVLTYWTTMTAIPQLRTETGFTSTVGTYTVARDECEILTEFTSDGKTSTGYTNTCSSGEQSTVTTVINQVQPTTSTFISTGTYVLSSSVLSVLPESYSTTVRSTVSQYTGFASPSPKCSFTNCMPPKNCGTCTISGGHVELLYWPVPASQTPAPTPSGIFVNSTGPASVTAPATFLIEGVTITSPSVAISFETAYAKNDCNKTVGAAYTGSILVLPPNDVSSLLMGEGVGGMPGMTYVKDGETHVGPYFAKTALNYADLNWPYPLSAWLQQPRCHGYPGSCDYIVSGELKPILAVPSQLRAMDPAWASCGFDFGGLYDPPIALTSQASPATPTVPSNADPQPTNAEPVNTPEPPPASTPPTYPNPTPPASNDPSPSPGNQGPSANSDPAPYNPAPSDPFASDLTPNEPAIAPPPTTTQDIITVGTGSSAVTVRPAPSTGQVIVDSGDGQTTLDPGAVTTINNTPLTVDSTGDVVVGVSSTVPIEPPQTTPIPVTNVGTNVVEANPSGTGVVINSGVTLIPGQVTTVDNGDGTLATISVDPSNSVVIDNGAGSTQTVAVPTPAPQVVAGQTVSSVSEGGVVLGGTTTLSAGGPPATATDGVVFSVGTDGGLRVLSSSTASRNDRVQTGAADGLIDAVLSVATANSDGSTSVFTGDSGTFTATLASDGSNNIVIQGSTTTLTLIPGESAVVDGEIVRVDSTGRFVAGTTTSIDQEQVTPEAVIAVTAGTFEAGGSTFTAIQQGGTSQGVVIDGTTLSMGEAAMINGDMISLSPTGLIEINADGSTSTIALSASEITVAPSTEVEALLTLSHAGMEEIITAYQLKGERGVIEIDGHTLSIGGEALTTAGVTISLAPGGQLVTCSAGESSWDIIPFASVTQTRPGLPTRFGAWATGTKTTSAKPLASAGQSAISTDAEPTSPPEAEGAASALASMSLWLVGTLVVSVLML